VDWNRGGGLRGWDTRPGPVGVTSSLPSRVRLKVWLNQLCSLSPHRPPPISPVPACLAVSLSLLTSCPQFSQLGGGPYVLCTDGQQLLRQVLHPEASRKVWH
jgi:hypothetical protein